MPIKTFKGKIEVGGLLTLRLSTNSGKLGYRVTKFQVISSTPGTGSSVEYVAKLFSIKPTAINAAVNLSDQSIMGVVYYQDRANASSNTETIIVDNKVINQDMFITLADADGNTLAGNYYVELEQLPLSEHEAGIATLTDMRGSA